MQAWCRTPFDLPPFICSGKKRWMAPYRNPYDFGVLYIEAAIAEGYLSHNRLESVFFTNDETLRENLIFHLNDST
jgi:hypothetical protein